MPNEDEAANAQEIFRYYLRLINTNVDDFANKRLRLKLPGIPAPIMKSLLSHASQLFKREATLINITGPVVVVGDLHGHLLDLFRIMKEFREPPHSKYLFLGDLVDRGEFSIETATLIFIMKVLFPNNVYVIRGNHEFVETTENLGFLAEIHSLYGSREVFDSFMEVFSYLPLGARINGDIICLHGGIGPNVCDMDAVASIARPIRGYGNEVVTDVLWSDPTTQLPMYFPSTRGYGALYGVIVFNEFLDKAKASCLVRGHQCVEEGCESMFDGKLFTVFSASHYCGTTLNKSGVLLVNAYGEKEPRVFPMLPYLKRSEVAFVTSESETKFKIAERGRLSVSGVSSQQQIRIPLRGAQKIATSRGVLSVKEPHISIKQIGKKSHVVVHTRKRLSIQAF